MQRVGFHRVCLTTLARRVKTMAARGEHWRGDRMVRARLGWGGLGLAVGRGLLAGARCSPETVGSGAGHPPPALTGPGHRPRLPFPQPPPRVLSLDPPHDSPAR